ATALAVTAGPRVELAGALAGAAASAASAHVALAGAVTTVIDAAHAVAVARRAAVELARALALALARSARRHATRALAGAFALERRRRAGSLEPRVALARHHGRGFCLAGAMALDLGAAALHRCVATRRRFDGRFGGDFTAWGVVLDGDAAVDAAVDAAFVLSDDSVGRSRRANTYFGADGRGHLTQGGVDQPV